jgi:hypothetical protein
VSGVEVTLSIRFQALSLIELEPRIDLDGDGLLAPRELEAGHEAIAGYLERSYRLSHAGAPLSGTLEALVFAASPADASTPSSGFQWLEARFRYAPPAPPERIALECRLFQEANPFHRDLLRVLHEDDPPVEHIFTAEDPRWTFEAASARRPGVLGLFLRLGIDHILRGYDHLAFVLVLLLAVKRWRGLLTVVTAFTVAHSIALAAVALDPGGWLDRIPDRFVELAIALSIAWVASGNLVQKELHTPWLEAFGFGLLHGLGFASFLGEALAGEPLVVTALFGFNLGVELGQLLAVAAFALLLLPFALAACRRAASGARADERSPAGAGATPCRPAVGIVPRWLRLWLSGAVTLLALYWFAQRAGWMS